jgi:peptide/nickel transport system ATP-binding protein/oligopeptide transport system ATP-binding protein
MTLLDVRDLKTHFFTEEGVVRAVDGVSFSVAKGEVLGIVGESGSGKTIASLSILGLVPDPPGRIVGGQILFGEGEAREDLRKASPERMRAIRGDRIAMVFQDPMTSLNPYLTVGQQLAEVLDIHQGVRGKEADDRCAAMLADVGIPAPRSRLSDYPHQLSGGMRQRVMIAMALLCQPALLIADEPTTALDVTIQAQILTLIEERKDELGLAVILITHDLGVVARMADRVAVMYSGKIVEQGSASAVFGRCLHPYTRALLRSVPRVDVERGSELAAIRGMPPLLTALPAGCPFHPRCDHAVDRCKSELPAERRQGEQLVRCHVELPAAVEAEEAQGG